MGAVLCICVVQLDNKEAQPVHIDPALPAMINQSLQIDSSTAGQTYHVNVPSSSDTVIGFKGSQLPSSNDAPPFPDSMERCEHGTVC